MNVFKTVMKIVVALAAVAGVVYVVATYGDRIVAWAKKLLGSCCCCCDGDCDCDCECDCCEEIEAVEEAAEAPVEAAAEVVAAEQDFEG